MLDETFDDVDRENWHLYDNFMSIETVLNMMRHNPPQTHIRESKLCVCFDSISLSFENSFDDNSTNTTQLPISMKQIYCNLKFGDKSHILSFAKTKLESFANDSDKNIYTFNSSNEEVYIWDVFEYYGNDLFAIDFAVDSGEVISKSSIPLSFLLNHQESLEIVQDNVSSNDHGLFVLKNNVDIGSSDSKQRIYLNDYNINLRNIPIEFFIPSNCMSLQSSCHITNKPAYVQIDICLKYRFIQIQNCLNLSSLSIYEQNSNNSTSIPNNNQQENIRKISFEKVHELHLAAAYAPPRVLIDLLTSLAFHHTIERVFSLKTSFNRSVFEFAISKDNFQNARILLQRAGNLCFQSLLGGQACPLHYAVHTGSLECVSLIMKFMKKFGPITSTLSGDINLNHLIEWRDCEDYTPLALACKLGSKSNIVHALLHAGADPGALSSKTNQTPFSLAVAAGDRDNMRILLKILKPSKELFEIIRDNPKLAVYYSFRKVRILCCVSYCHQPINIFKNKSNSPKHREQRRDSLVLLKCNPNFRDESTGKTAVLLAAEFGRLEVLQELLDLGMSYLDIDCAGNSIIHLAASKGYVDIVDLIFELELKNWEKYRDSLSTPMDEYAYRRRILTTKNSLGLAPLDLAVMAKFDDIIKKLKCADEIYRKNTSVPANEISDNAYGSSTDRFRMGYTLGRFANFKTDEKSHANSYDFQQQSQSQPSKRRFSLKPFKFFSFFRFREATLSTGGSVVGDTSARQPAEYSELLPVVMSIPKPSSSSEDFCEDFSVVNELEEDDNCYCDLVRIVDDAADSLEYKYALAIKGLQSQGYYNVVSYQNKLLQESAPEEEERGGEDKEIPQNEV